MYVSYAEYLCQPLLVSVPLRSQYGDHLSAIAVLAEGQVRVVRPLLWNPAAADIDIHRVDEVFGRGSSDMRHVAVSMH